MASPGFLGWRDHQVTSVSLPARLGAFAYERARRTCPAPLLCGEGPAGCAPEKASELKGIPRLFVRVGAAAHGWMLGARRPLRHDQTL